MAKYEIRKETRNSNEIFVHLYYEGGYVSSSSRLANTPEREKEGIGYLKNLIQGHKETGNFEITETIYTED